MNERIKQIAASSLIIKQLAKQAEEYASIECDNDSDLDWYELKDEKFAELIVQECSKVIVETPNKIVDTKLSRYNEGWRNGRLLAKEHIELHFGVNNAN